VYVSKFQGNKSIVSGSMGISAFKYRKLLCEIFRFNSDFVIVQTLLVNVFKSVTLWNVTVSAVAFFTFYANYIYDI